MGNCTGVFGACVGEEQQAVKKIDRDNIKRALAANEFDAGTALGGGPDPSVGGHYNNNGYTNHGGIAGK